MERELFFRLVYADGSNFIGSMDFVEMLPHEIVADLWKAVKQANENKLAHIDAVDLIIYANSVAFAENRPMSPADSIRGIGESFLDPVIVQVPVGLRPLVEARLTPTTTQEGDANSGLKRLTWFLLVNHNSGVETSPSLARLDHDALVTELWMAVKDIYRDTLLHGVAPSDLVIFSNGVALAENRPMSPADSIADFGTCCEDPVIVQIPAPPSSPSRDQATPTHVNVPKPRWKSAPKTELRSLADQAKDLARFDDAVKQLSKAHESCFLGATQGSRADLWPIVLVTNCSKVERAPLGLNYIRRCIESWPTDRKAPGFRESLCAAHTLYIVPKPHTFATVTSGLDLHGIEVSLRLEDTINGLLVDKILSELDLPVGSSLPDFLTPPTVMDGELCLQTVVDQLGPVFIVLDEIGQAFAFDDSDGENAQAKSRTLFLRFCTNVLTTWMDTKGVYFVLMGDAPFLRNIEEAVSNRKLWASPYTVTRLRL